MKTICIYHKNCFDGICAAWVTNKKFPNCEIMPMGYGDSLDWLTQGWNQGIYSQEDKLIIVDFSFKRNTMESLKEMFPSLLVLDHHKTAEEACKGLDFCKFDMNESGASLAWKYFFPNQAVPNLIRYVADRDLWKFELFNSEIINAFIQSWPMTIQSYEMLYHGLESTTGMLEANLAGQAIERYKKTMVEAICKTHFMKNIGGHQVPLVNTSLLFSEVGHELCKQFPGAPFAAYYYDRINDEVRQYGLRSIGDFDVSAVAKQFGGEGHLNAAGFEQKLSEL